MLLFTHFFTYDLMFTGHMQDIPQIRLESLLSLHGSILFIII